MKFTVAAICVLLAIAGKAQGAAHSGTVVSLAAGEEGFGTLVAALEATGLNDTLSEAGPFTVFAPSDSAFVALLTEKAMDAAALLARDDLASILTYHVVPGKVMSTDLTDGMMPATVNGAKVEIKITDGTVMVNDATVTTADLAAGNGVIHVIDKVLMPPAEATEAPADDGSAGSMTVLSALAGVASLMLSLVM